MFRWSNKFFSLLANQSKRAPRPCSRNSSRIVRSYGKSIFRSPGLPLVSSRSAACRQPRMPVRRLTVQTLAARKDCVLIPTSIQSTCWRTIGTIPDKFTLGNVEYRLFLDHLVSEYDTVNKELVSESRESSPAELNSRLLYLTPIVTLIKEMRQKVADVEELNKLLANPPQYDEELAGLADKEREECLDRISEIQHELVDCIVPSSGENHTDVVLEVTAGVGGQEAMLFTGDLFDMYQGYCSHKGWAFSVLTYDTSELGGLRHATASVTGDSVYHYLKFEGGIHRVQRVPRTEKSGRVHTSTAAVAVLPQPDEIDIVIHPKDLKIETCRASGSGGQHVNTTDSAVRILHIPTGVAAECQTGRSQIQNKEAAMKMLRSRLYQKQFEEQQSQYRSARKIQIGSAARSDKIRTYNFPQDRISDHRLGQNFYNLDQFLKGGEELDALLEALLLEDKYDMLSAIVEEFIEKRKSEKAES